MRRSFYTRRHNVGQRIPRDRLHVGMQIHLSHTNFSCVWRITEVETANSKGDVWLKLIAPLSGKTRRSNSIYATYIRRDEPTRRPW